MAGSTIIKKGITSIRFSMSWKLTRRLFGLGRDGSTRTSTLQKLRLFSEGILAPISGIFPRSSSGIISTICLYKLAPNFLFRSFHQLSLLSLSLSEQIGLQLTRPDSRGHQLTSLPIFFAAGDNGTRGGSATRKRSPSSTRAS